MRLAALAAVLALPACATVRAEGGAQSISYEAGPCFGACPIYRVIVNADGTGLFEGRRFTAVTGERRFTVTPAQYRAFAAQLAPVRPASGDLRYSGAPLCQRMATDLASAEITWRSGGGVQRLYVYYGCDMERNRALIDRVAAAPALLPIGDFIRAAR
ncbi:MAG: hypothetical protein QOJ53_1403 [Sphingomonadales bacterium]|jgi:hypothetical protein|nr:hypothetical protein [Sphingomonadales bacterium]MEA3047071.1 hypothetical protein [Sphingomonadales bacterium]